MSSAWKNFEREVGRCLGTQRNVGSGTMGRTDHSACDVHHPYFFIEAKNRKGYQPLVNSFNKERKKLDGRSINMVMNLYSRGKDLMCYRHGDYPSLFDDICGDIPSDALLTRIHVHRDKKITSPFPVFNLTRKILEERPEGKVAPMVVIRSSGMHGFLVVVEPEYLVNSFMCFIAGDLYISEHLRESGLPPSDPTLKAANDRIRSIINPDYEGFVRGHPYIGNYHHRWQYQPKKGNEVDEQG